MNRAVLLTILSIGSAVSCTTILGDDFQVEPESGSSSNGGSSATGTTTGPGVGGASSSAVASGGAGAVTGSGGAGGGVPACADGTVDAGELCFQDASVSYPIDGNNITDIVAVDCQGDADFDLVASSYDATLTTLINDGAGAFPTSQSATSLAGAPEELAVGDFAIDAGMELAVAYDGVSYVDYYKLDAVCKPTLESVEYFTNGSQPGGVAVGDFGGGSGPDLVILENAPNGMFFSIDSGASDAALSMNFFGNGAAAANFDGLNKHNVAFALPLSNAVRVFFHNGTQVVEAGGISLAVAGNPLDIEAGTIDAGASVDFVTANRDGDSVTVALNNGAGQFTKVAVDASVASGVVGTAPATDPVNVELADMNGDGFLDVVTANSNTGLNEGSVSVLLNDGTGVLTVAPGFPIAVARDATAVTVADLNGDGALDIATSSAYVDASSKSTISVLLATP